MKILLIKPKWFVKGGIYRYLEKIKFSPLALGILASLSPGHEVKIIDEDWQEIPYNEEFDLVGITTTTFTSQRAYEIAGRFRKRNIRVILGGVHPSLMPEECLNYVDSVVVGEAENIWKNVLNDLAAGKLEKIYRTKKPVSMDDVPLPRRDLMNDMSWFACVQATRGCPNQCKYCYLPSTPWAQYRKRRPESVIEEISKLRQKVIYFIDDNLFADKIFVEEICAGIKPLKKLWSSQAPTYLAKDEELVSKIAEAGCFNVQVGFQSVNAGSLQWAKIRHNKVEEYKNVVDVFHRYGILVTGFFIFGFDGDDKNVFRACSEMIKYMDIDEAHLYILTPYPGTEMYEEFRNEGRLLDKGDRTKFGWADALFTPKNMTARELEEGVRWAYNELHPFFRKKVKKEIFRRLPFFIKNPALLKTLLLGSKKKVSG